MHGKWAQMHVICAFVSDDGRDGEMNKEGALRREEQRVEVGGGWWNNGVRPSFGGSVVRPVYL